MDLVGRECMRRAQIFVEQSNCCQGAKVNVNGSMKSFLAAIQMGHEISLDNSVGDGNVEK